MACDSRSGWTTCMLPTLLYPLSAASRPPCRKAEQDQGRDKIYIIACMPSRAMAILHCIACVSSRAMAILPCRGVCHLSYPLVVGRSAVSWVCFKREMESSTSIRTHQQPLHSLKNGTIYAHVSSGQG